MPHVILPNLLLVLFFVCFVVENFKKILIYHLAMGTIIVYRTPIIPNILNKVANCMGLKIVKGWSI